MSALEIEKVQVWKELNEGSKKCKEESGKKGLQVLVVCKKRKEENEQEVESKFARSLKRKGHVKGLKESECNKVSALRRVQGRKKVKKESKRRVQKMKIQEGKERS